MLRNGSTARLFVVLILSALGHVASGALTRAWGLDLPPLRSDRPPYFTADVAISIDRDTRPAMSVSITVPYPELQWLRLPNRYVAGAEFTVVFEPSGAGRLYGDVWERRIAVGDFSSTRSMNSTLVERRSIQVPPGRYQVRISVRDVNADQGSTTRDRLTVPDYSKLPVGFADLELGVVDSSGVFSPISTRQFGLNVQRIAARTALFDRRPGPWPRIVPLRYKILDDQGQEILSGTQNASLAQSADPVVIRPGTSDLFIGSYLFEVDLVEGRSRWRVDRSFEVEESGPPQGRDFDRILGPLLYIADPDEIEYLRNLPAEARARGWEDFWRRRDPSPETDRNEAMLEFFRRLRYAEQHFQGFGPGWRSDMGRIYIKLGPPDQVENRPPALGSPQLEIWYYKQPYRRLVFVDREGFGRYILSDPGVE